VKPSGKDAASGSNVASLYEYEWKLVRLIPAEGAVKAHPDAPTSLRFLHGEHASEPSIVSSGKCTAAQARIDSTTMTFVQGFVSLTTTDCGPELGVSQSRFVYDVLSGTVQWTIKSGHLLITKHGNELEFARSAPERSVASTGGAPRS
jgi:hypothetical protein